MRVIVGGRGTGKTAYCEMCAGEDTLIVRPKLYSGSTRKQITAQRFLHCLKRNLRVEQGRRITDFSVIFEEPGLYDREFIEIMDLIDRKNIDMIIGTAIGNRFDTWLTKYNKKIIRWTQDHYELNREALSEQSPTYS